MKCHTAKVGRFYKKILLGSVVWMFTVTAHAVPVNWTLSGTFDDGGTASGSFTYDADTNTYSAIAITTTAGSTRGGASYNEPNVNGDSDSTQIVATNSVNSPDYTGDPAFFPIFASPLTNTGGTINISGGAEGSCADGNCTGEASPIRDFTAGSITGALPTPAAPSAVPTMPLYGLVLTMLGVLVISGRRFSNRYNLR